MSCAAYEEGEHVAGAPPPQWDGNVQALPPA